MRKSTFLVDVMANFRKIDMVYILFFHRQYKVISKQIASEMLPYTVNERRPPYNPKVVLPQLLYR